MATCGRLLDCTADECDSAHEFFPPSNEGTAYDKVSLQRRGGLLRKALCYTRPFAGMYRSQARCGVEEKVQCLFQRMPHPIRFCDIVGSFAESFAHAKHHSTTFEVHISPDSPPAANSQCSFAWVVPAVLRPILLSVKTK